MVPDRCENTYEILAHADANVRPHASLLIPVDDTYRSLATVTSTNDTRRTKRSIHREKCVHKGHRKCSSDGVKIRTMSWGIGGFFGSTVSVCVRACVMYVHTYIHIHTYIHTTYIHTYIHPYI